MRIELFGLARAHAGATILDIDVKTLGEALGALEAAGLDIAHFRFCLNGERFVSNPELALAATDTLVVMGAQAGG